MISVNPQSVKTRTLHGSSEWWEDHNVHVTDIAYRYATCKRILLTWYREEKSIIHILFSTLFIRNHKLVNITSSLRYKSQQCPLLSDALTVRRRYGRVRFDVTGYRTVGGPAIDRPKANLFSRSVPNRPIAIAALFATLLASERGRHCCGWWCCPACRWPIPVDASSTNYDDFHPALHMQSNPYDNVVAAWCHHSPARNSNATERTVRTAALVKV